MNAYADALRHQVEQSPRIGLPNLAALVWRTFGEGHLTEEEAGALSALIDSRRQPPAKPAPKSSAKPPAKPPAAPQGDLLADPLAEPSTPDDLQDRQDGPRTGVGSRPRTPASLARRRRWSASGRIPMSFVAHFSPGEQAVLACVVAETIASGDCRLAIDRIGASAGVCATTVRNTLHHAKKLGLVTVEERRFSAFRNETNIIRIVSPEWIVWMRMEPDRPSRKRGFAPPWGRYWGGFHGGGGGCKFLDPTSTQVLNRGKKPPKPGRKSRRAGPSELPRGSPRATGA